MADLLIRKLSDQKLIIAIDGTLLRELLNPEIDKEKPKLGFSIAHAIVKPHQASLPHRLKTSSEVYYIIQGKGRVHIDDETSDVVAGDTIYIPPNARQYIENTGDIDLAFLCLVDPAWRAQDEELITPTLE